MIVINNQETDVLAEVFSQQRSLTEQELKTLRALMGRVWDDRQTREQMRSLSNPKK